MPTELDELKQRVGKLEKPGRIWPLIQILLAPALVVWLGFHFDAQLQQTKNELEKIEVAHQLVKEALSGDHERSLIILRLVQVVLEPELADEIVAGVTDYLIATGQSALEHGRPEGAIAIVKAAERVGGDAAQHVAEELREAPDYAQADRARRLIDDGVVFLTLRRFPEALEALQAAQEVSPRYARAAAAITVIEEGMRFGIDDPQVQGTILRDIRLREFVQRHVPPSFVEEELSEVSPEEER